MSRYLILALFFYLIIGDKKARADPEIKWPEATNGVCKPMSPNDFKAWTKSTISTKGCDDKVKDILAAGMTEEETILKIKKANCMCECASTFAYLLSQRAQSSTRKWTILHKVNPTRIDVPDSDRNLWGIAETLQKLSGSLILLQVSNPFNKESVTIKCEKTNESWDVTANGTVTVPLDKDQPCELIATREGLVQHFPGLQKQQAQWQLRPFPELMLWVGREGEPPEAKRSFDQAQDKAVAGDWAGAAKDYQASIQAASHPETLFNLGVATLEQNQLVDAVRLFQGLIESKPQGLDLEPSKTRVTELGKRLGRVIVDSGEAGTAVSLDCNKVEILETAAVSAVGSVNPAPRLRDSQMQFWVTPFQECTVNAKKDNRTATETIRAPDGGAVLLVKLKLAPPPPPPPRGYSSKPLFCGLGGTSLGVGVAGLGGAVVLSIMASHNAGTKSCNADRICDDSGWRAINHAKTQAYGSDALWIGGGAFAISGAVLLIVGAKTKTSTPTPGGARLSIKASWNQAALFGEF